MYTGFHLTLTSIFSISWSHECHTLFPQSSRMPWCTHTLTAHSARYIYIYIHTYTHIYTHTHTHIYIYYICIYIYIYIYIYITGYSRERGVRISKRYKFDTLGPATHGAAHAAVPSRLLCIYSNYMTSRIHCSPHHDGGGGNRALTSAAETGRDRGDDAHGTTSSLPTSHLSFRSSTRGSLHAVRRGAARRGEVRRSEDSAVECSSRSLLALLRLLAVLVVRSLVVAVRSRVAPVVARRSCVFHETKQRTFTRIYYDVKGAALPVATNRVRRDATVIEASSGVHLSDENRLRCVLCAKHFSRTWWRRGSWTFRGVTSRACE